MLPPGCPAARGVRRMVTGLAAVAAAAVAVARAAADAPFVLIATQRTGSAWIEQTLKDRVCDVDADVEIMLDNDWCDDEAHARQKHYSEKKRTAAREGRRRLHGHCERNLTLHRLALEALFDPSAPVPAGLARPTRRRRPPSRTAGARKRGGAARAAACSRDSARPCSGSQGNRRRPSTPGPTRCAPSAPPAASREIMSSNSTRRTRAAYTQSATRRRRTHRAARPARRPG